MADGINSFFWALVVAALNSLLRLVAQTLLATPTLDQLPRIGELWESSRGIAVASYALLIMVAGIVLMAYETLQARTTIRQTAPRIVVGFLAANLSLILAAKAIELANALSYALVGGGVDPSGAAQTLSALLTHTVMNSITSSGFFGVLVGLGLVVLLVALIGSYVVRVALTAVLVAGAPLFLVCHGLEQTEGIARWWWRAFFGVLAVQVGQSLALITALRVFFAEGGFTLFGPTPDGMVNLIATGGLIWILVKIPSWVMAHVQLGGGRRSMLGSLVRAFVAYKTFGLLRGRGGSGHSGPRSTGGNGGGSGGGRGSADPYAHARTTADGQYMLPLAGVRRSRPAAKPRPAPAPKPSAGHGRQLTLPLDDGWPENKPVLGRDGQYRLPLDVERVKPTPPPLTPPGPSARGRGGKQLELPFDPYRGNRPDRSGQYRLPLDGVRRVPRPPSPPSPPPPPARSRARQLELPFDPYKGNRPTHSGQYPLPLDGLRRVPPATPAPPPPPPPRKSSPAGRQLRLPLDLPTRPRRSSPPPPTPGGTP
ncbi:hypothetical protein SAMN04488074_1376 [Lentzea albidocapillata subsp. violacea]|uniref:Uncharacterized protein n=1 Tax=Lentzea albidocapillata subsp. violacea TaxID=128104 RepID=A0A1G9Z2Z1_9PSEU|nr:hypothetical protein [Lentzea albidocapillata]SDN15720.1 hypothetical protein SAMN04488074_1376 [Lentzea albidocapillata subsp. violacea]